MCLASYDSLTPASSCHIGSQDHAELRPCLYWLRCAGLGLLSVWSDGKQASPISHISDYWRRHSARPRSSCWDHSGRSEIPILASWWIFMTRWSRRREGVGVGGRRVIFSNFLAGTGDRGRPWEILLTLLRIGTIQRLAGLKCWGG